jgi:hypothetical protein
MKTFPLVYYVAVDFDGTCVTHEFPSIGRDVGAQPVLKRLVDELDAKLILNTMRSGDTLSDAVQWFEDNDIPLYGINVNPTQQNWTASPKVYAHVYIDDAALGAPLIIPQSNENGERPYIDWTEVEKYFFNEGQQ